MGTMTSGHPWRISDSVPSKSKSTWLISGRGSSGAGSSTLPQREAPAPASDAAAHDRPHTPATGQSPLLGATISHLPLSIRTIGLSNQRTGCIIFGSLID